ncbi:MAG: hypothetical protein DMG95_00205, partial [Acidobacteria bacterium]
FGLTQERNIRADGIILRMNRNTATYDEHNCEIHAADIHVFDLSHMYREGMHLFMPFHRLKFVIA